MNELSPEALVGGIAALISAIFVVRKKWAFDSHAIQTDKVEVKFYNQLSEELERTRTDLNEISKERNTLMLEVGMLRSQVEFLKRENSYQERRIKALEHKLGIRLDTGLGDI